MKFKLYQGDCLERLKRVGHVTCIFADPPDNIGLGYDEYDDKLADDSYRKLLHDWTLQFMRTASIVWISFNARWTFAMGQCFDSLLSAFPDWEGKACTQVFTFGQHNKHDLGNNHRPLWRLKHKDAPLYPEAIKVPSWRQRNGDKRAAAGGRVPGDVFDMQYFDEAKFDADTKRIAELNTKSMGVMFATGINTDREAMKKRLKEGVGCGDVFDFPRVTGNSAQRCDWHPTQLHEELVERCIKLSTTEGDTVVDPFGGTGTTLRVCERLKRPCTLIELDEGYCKQIAKANGLKVCRSPGTWGK
jgi:DNA modification methylase